MTRRRSSTLALAIAAGGAIACQTLAGLERPARVEPTDAGPTTGPGPAETPNACEAQTFARPVNAAPGSDQDPAIDLVIGYIHTDPAPPAADAGVELCARVGFDLDDRRTCRLEDGGNRDPAQSKDPASPWGPSCVSSHVVCDDSLGNDDALGALISRSNLQRIPSINPDRVDPNRFLRAGRSNLLFRITGYNGRENDAEVKVSFFLSSGIASADQPVAHPELLIGDAGAAGAAWADGGWASDPTAERWDGRALREWYLDPNGLTNVVAKISQAAADGYVTHNILVVESTAVPLPIYGIVLQVDRARISGELRKRGSAWELVRGRIGGRLTTENVISALGAIPYSAPGVEATLCEKPELMTFVKENVCAGADLGAANDPSEPCNRVSFGATFVAVPAIVSATVWAPSRTRSICDAGDLGHCE